jgi:hypothetical protein
MLTRDVPFGMGAVVAPIIRNVPGESLRNSLEHTRQAVLNEPHLINRRGFDTGPNKSRGPITRNLQVKRAAVYPVWNSNGGRFSLP